MQKKLLFVVIIVVNGLFVNAQLLKSVLPSPAFTNALEKIVLDFRHNYETIRGGLIDDKTGTDIYTSTLTLPGAIQSTITYYHSEQDTTASWQAIVYDGDDYKEAVKAYENTYRLVKKSQLHWIDRSSVGFTGAMEPINENVRFATSSLMLTANDERYKNFRAEVEMLSTYAGWEVHLSLLNKKPDSQKF